MAKEDTRTTRTLIHSSRLHAHPPTRLTRHTPEQPSVLRTQHHGPVSTGASMLAGTNTGTGMCVTAGAQTACNPHMLQASGDPVVSDSRRHSLAPGTPRGEGDGLLYFVPCAQKSLKESPWSVLSLLTFLLLGLISKLSEQRLSLRSSPGKVGGPAGCLPASGPARTRRAGAG